MLVLYVLQTNKIVSATWILLFLLFPLFLVILILIHMHMACIYAFYLSVLVNLCCFTCLWESSMLFFLFILSLAINITLVHHHYNHCAVSYLFFFLPFGIVYNLLHHLFFSLFLCVLFWFIFLWRIWCVHVLRLCVNTFHVEFKIHLPIMIITILVILCVVVITDIISDELFVPKMLSLFKRVQCLSHTQASSSLERHSSHTHFSCFPFNFTCIWFFTPECNK